MSGRQVSWPAEIVIVGSSIFASLAMSALSPVLPDIKDSYPHIANIAFWAKMIVTIDGVAMMAAPFAGWVAAQYGGPRKVMIVAYIMFLLFGVAGAFSPSIWLIIATRFFVGISAAMIVTLTLTLISDRYDGNARETRIGFMHALGSATIGILVPVSGWLGDNYGWRFSFAVHLIAVPYLILLLMSPELAQFKHKASGIKGGLHGLATAIPVALLAMLCGSIALGIPIFLPFRVREIGVNSATIAGFIFTTTAFCSVMTGLSFGFVRRYLSVPAVFTLAFALWSIGMTCTGLATNLPGLALGAMLIGLGGGFTQPALFSAVAGLSDEDNRARNTGLAKSLFYGGPFIGTSILHLLFDDKPSSASLYAMGGVAALMSVTALIVAVRMRGKMTVAA